MGYTVGSLERTRAKYATDFWGFTNDLLSYHGINRHPFADFHKQVISTIMGSRHSLIILPRGHLKTTLSDSYVLWKLLIEPKRFEAVRASSTLGQSKKQLGFVQDMLENTPWLKPLVPEDRNTTWNKTFLKTNTMNTYEIKPFNDSSRGAQPDLLIYDDILRDADIKPTDVIDIFWNIFFPMGQTKRCKHVVVGTPMSVDDLFNDIGKKSTEPGSEWSVLRLAAWNKNSDGERIPIWPSCFSIERLDQIKRDMGAHAFNREYLCNPLAEGSGFFHREMIMNASDDSMTFNYKTSGIVTIGCDFAMSESATADYNVFTVVDSISETIKRKVKFDGVEFEVEVHNPVVVKYIDRWRGPVGQANRIKELCEQYKATKAIVDASVFGQKFAQELRELGVSVDAQDFRPANRNQLLVNLRKLFECDDPKVSLPRLVIPTSQENFTFDKTKVLLNELSGFNETRTSSGAYSTIASNMSHDDTVFSLCLAVKDVQWNRSLPDEIIWDIPDKRQYI
jgi:hypothetical protein